jgi:catechol 2,3-dioxygenase-like lactoylglutathione lyase family enzyme
MTRPGDAVLGVDNVLFAVGDLDAAVAFYTELGLPLVFRLDEIALFRLGSETPGLLVRRGEPTGGGRVWLEVPDVHALPMVDKAFRVATGWTVEVTDPWGNAVGFTDYTAMPERGRPAPSAEVDDMPFREH